MAQAMSSQIDVATQKGHIFTPVPRVADLVLQDVGCCVQERILIHVSVSCLWKNHARDINLSCVSMDTHIDTCPRLPKLPCTLRCTIRSPVRIQLQIGETPYHQTEAGQIQAPQGTGTQSCRWCCDGALMPTKYAASTSSAPRSRAAVKEHCHQDHEASKKVPIHDDNNTHPRRVLPNRDTANAPACPIRLRNDTHRVARCTCRVANAIARSCGFAATEAASTAAVKNSIEFPFGAFILQTSIIASGCNNRNLSTNALEYTYLTNTVQVVCIPPRAPQLP